MQKIWIVIANSSQAKIYRAENTHVLVEHAIFFHEESHLHGSELESDRHGRETNPRNVRICGSNAYEQKTPVKVKEAVLFADIVADFLDKGFNAQEVEKIYLVAKAPFLGHLHQSLSPNIIKLISSEIHKDLTHLSPDQIREYLPPVL